MKIVLSTAALVLAVTTSNAVADPPFRLKTIPGVRHYRYTAMEQTQGQPPSGYRVDFDLATDADGGVVAIIRKAEARKGDTWSGSNAAAECKKSLHGKGSELARITLNPVTPAAAASLGEPFMAMCAPAEYFFPMTDILNVSLIQTSPRFQLQALTSPGASSRFDGFTTKLERYGKRIEAASQGGSIKLTSLDDHIATVDWTPDPMQLTIVEQPQAGQPPITLTGTETFAFRVEIDRATGVLRSAATTADDLAMVVSMPGLPADKAPHVAIKREVTIEPLN